MLPCVFVSVSVHDKYTAKVIFTLFLKLPVEGSFARFHHEIFMHLMNRKSRERDLTFFHGVSSEKPLNAISFKSNG